jgi:hypothetical protein
LFGKTNASLSGLAKATDFFVCQKKWQRVRPFHKHVILHSPKKGLRKKDGIKNY